MKKTIIRLLPIFIFLFICYAGMNSLFVSVNHLKLREFCKEYGYVDGKCNDKRALAAMSRYSTILSVFGGISIISTGFWAAVSNRLGRKLIIVISMTGCVLAGLAWSSIYTLDWALDRWKYISIVGWTCMAAGGGLLLVFLAVYGSLTDVSAEKPRNRPWLFVIIDAIMAVSGIVGIQLPAFLLSYDLRYLTYTISVVLLVSLLFALLFVRNTIPEQISAQPIDWTRAHTIGSILFMCPVPHTRRLLHDDAQQIYDHRMKQYNAQSQSIFSTHDDDDTDLETVRSSQGDNQIVYDPRSTPSHLIAVVESHANLSTSTTDDLHTSLLVSQDSSDTDDSSPDDTEEPTQLYPALDEPIYVPPGNTVYLMGAITGIVFTLMMGHRTVAFLYLKQEFSISAHFYSNLLTAEAICRAIGTLVLTPVLKPRIKTRTQEVKVIKYSMILKAIFLGMIPFCKTLWLTFVFCLLSQLSSCLVTGFVRGLISNEVSTQLQGRILGGLASMDVVVLTFGGVIYNLIFNYTSDFFPAFAYLFMSFLAFIGAILPAFISDDAKTFNARHFGGVTFDKPLDKQEAIN